jgi:hypothetical protein
MKKTKLDKIPDHVVHIFVIKTCQLVYTLRSVGEPREKDVSNFLLSTGEEPLEHYFTWYPIASLDLLN